MDMIVEIHVTKLLI